MQLELACTYVLTILVDAYHENKNAGYSIDQLGRFAVSILDVAYTPHEIEYDYEADEAFFQRHGDYKTPEIAAECDVVEAFIADPDLWVVDQAAVKVLAEIAETYVDIRRAIKNAHEWRNSPAGISELLTLDKTISFSEIYERIAGFDVS